MRKRIALLGAGLVVIVLLGIGVWWLFSSGRLVYAASGLQSTASAVVCGSDVVDTYNEAAYYLKRDESDTPTMDEQGLKKLDEAIKAKKGYETDATCQTIVFWIAVQNRNASAAETALKAINDLYAKRMFADSNIRSDQPLFTYQGYVDELKAPSEGEGGN